MSVPTIYRGICVIALDGRGLAWVIPQRSGTF
jgi:hypothetical protein